MVVVPKKFGNVRICVDLKPLNEVVLQETHPIPSVDDTLAQLLVAKVFSKVDAKIIQGLSFAYYIYYVIREILLYKGTIWHF